MKLETKYIHLRQPVAVGQQMDGWKVCWLGGWDRQRVFFVAMLVRVNTRNADSAKQADEPNK